MDFIRDCVSWPEWWLFALAAPCVVALLIIAITEIKNDRYWRAWIPLWMYDLPVPTPREIGGETSGSYEGNSTLSGSRTKTVDTRSRRKRHSKARNMRTSEKKSGKPKERGERERFARSEASHEEERSGDTELNSDIGKNALGWWALGVTMVLALVIFLRWRYGKRIKQSDVWAVMQQRMTGDDTRCSRSRTCG